MKILFVTPECAPMAKTGGLGDVSAALPRALAALDCDVVTLMPAYGDMALHGTLLEIVALPSEGPWPSAQLLRVQPDEGPPLLLLSCPMLYGQASSPYGNRGDSPTQMHAMRFGLLAHVAARIGSRESPVGWQADIVHSNDWPCGLAPLYLHQMREAGETQAARSVMTIHNLAFQGLFPMESADTLQLAKHHRGIEGVEFWGQLSMLKAGLQYADVITTVSPTYAREIQHPSLGFGLDGVLRARAENLVGILNGIDIQVWNPATDPLIFAQFDADHLESKILNRAALRQHCNLKESSAPLFGLVSRLTEQKGVDLVLKGAHAILAAGAQLVVLGRGEADLEHQLLQLAQVNKGHVHVTLGFDEPLAHRIEAGADCFLMPSRFEPCGLNQMYSQAYGTPPIVTSTGGLSDTVVDADETVCEGTGFVMKTSTQEAFDDALRRVFNAWKNPQRWRALQRRGMQRSFNWEHAAVSYKSLYEQALRPTY